MKLIKGILVWQILGVAALYGMAQLVDGDFARHFAREVLLIALGIGLIRGIGAMNRARREKRDVQAALSREASSSQQRSAWAAESKKRAAEAWRLCAANNRSCGSGNPLFTAEYDDGDSLEGINSALMGAMQTRARLLEYCNETPREEDAQ